MDGLYTRLDSRGSGVSRWKVYFSRLGKVELMFYTNTLDNDIWIPFIEHSRLGTIELHEERVDPYTVDIRLEWYGSHIVTLADEFLYEGWARFESPLNRGDDIRIGPLYLWYFGCDCTTNMHYAVVVNSTVGMLTFQRLCMENFLYELKFKFLHFCAERGWMDVEEGQFLSFDKLKVVQYSEKKFKEIAERCNQFFRDVS